MPGRPLSWPAWAAAGFLATYGLLWAARAHARGLLPLWPGGLVLAIGAAAVAAAVKRAQVVYAAYLLAVTELALQGMAAAGLLPGVNVFEHAPFARVYWTHEGKGNGLMNRHGWHAPPFRLAPAGRRVLVIGDSFVEALGVARGDALGPRLQQRLGPATEVEVLSLGTGGTGPAHYLEVLDWGLARFAAAEAVLVVFLGNDVRNSSLELQGRVAGPERFPYYELRQGALRLHPASASPLESFRTRLRRREHVIRNAHAAAGSHLFLGHVLERLLRAPGHTPMPIDLLTVETPLAPEARRAFGIMEKLLDRAVETARRRAARVLVVGIPHFGPRFYAEARDEDWASDGGRLDWLLPERLLAAWAGRMDVPFLGVGSEWKADGCPRSEVRARYLAGGTGHLSPAGHAAVARAMARRFWAR